MTSQNKDRVLYEWPREFDGVNKERYSNCCVTAADGWNVGGGGGCWGQRAESFELRSRAGEFGSGRVTWSCVRRAGGMDWKTDP